jgi:hypothetical protein
MMILDGSNMVEVNSPSYRLTALTVGNMLLLMFATIFTTVELIISLVNLARQHGSLTELMMGSLFYAMDAFQSWSKHTKSQSSGITSATTNVFVEPTAVLEARLPFNNNVMGLATQEEVGLNAPHPMPNLRITPLAVDGGSSSASGGGASGGAYSTTIAGGTATGATGATAGAGAAAVRTAALDVGGGFNVVATGAARVDDGERPLAQVEFSLLTACYQTLKVLFAVAVHVVVISVNL